MAKNNITYSLNKNELIIEIKSVNTIIQILSDLKKFISSFEVIHGNMDDVFLNIIGDSQEDVKI